jgi:hypothetical protein
MLEQPRDEPLSARKRGEFSCALASSIAFSATFCFILDVVLDARSADPDNH